MDNAVPSWDESTPIATQTAPATGGAAPASSEAAPTWDESVPAEQYETPWQQAKTIGEGIARGATLGGSDVLETSPVPEPSSLTAAIMGGFPGLLEAKQLMGQVNPADTAGRMSANPVESTLGQIVGTGLGIAATGGVGEVGATAGMGQTAGLAKGIATRLAIATGKRAVEGAAFGASNAVTDYALGDPNLTSQKLLADVGAGSALNVALGPIGKVVESVIPVNAALTKALGKVKDTIGDLVSKIPGMYGKKLVAGLAGEVPENAINRLQNNVQELYDTHQAATNKVYDTWQAEAPELMKNTPFQPAMDAAQGVRQQLDTSLAHMEDNPDQYSPSAVKFNRTVISTLTNDLDAAETPEDIHKALWKARKTIDSNVNWADPAGPGAAKQAADQFISMRTGIGAAMKDPAVWGNGAAEQFSNIDDAYAQSAAASKDFKKQFTTTIGGKTVVNPGSMKSLYTNLNTDPDYNKKLQVFNNFVESATNMAKTGDNFTGAQDLGNTLQNRVQQVVKEHASIQELREILQQPKTPVKSLIEQGMTSGAAAMLGVSHPLVGAAMGAAQAYRYMANPYAVGRTMAETFNTIGALQRINTRVGKLIVNGTKGIISGPVRGATGAAALKTPAYQDIVNRIQQLNSSPQTMMQHLQDSTANISEGAPNVSMGVHNTLMSAANFLNSKIPKPVTQLPLSGEWKPSAAQKDQFLQYYETVNDPINSTFRSIQDGSFNNRQLEALQAVYPHLLTEMRTHTVSILNPEKTKEMPYSTQYALAKFLAQPLDGGMTDAAIASNQLAFMPSAQPPQGQQAPKRGGNGKGSLKNMDVANRAQTQSEELQKEEA